MRTFEHDPALPDNDSDIVVTAISKYMPDQSDLSQPGDEKYVFGYTIRIENKGSRTVKLLSRHWWITDAHQQVREVEGAGVVGEQPIITPGSEFRYSSWCVLSTSSGWMRGTYSMLSATGDVIEVPIPAFSLATSHALN